MTLVAEGRNCLLSALDHKLIHHKPHPELTGFRRFAVEFLLFGIKEARACLFAGLFFLSIFLVRAPASLAFRATICCCSSRWPSRSG